MDSLERGLAKIMRLSSNREDESKSIISNMSKTSKNVMDMSVNELLSLRIPIARSSSKIVEEDEENLNENYSSL